MSSLANILSAGVRKALGNRCYSKAILAINAVAAATIKSTNPITYSVDGVMYLKAALAAQSIAVTHDFDGKPVAQGFAAYAQPAGTSVHYVVALDGAGNVAVAQGTYTGQAIPYATDKSVVLEGSGGLPLEPDGFTAIGVLTVSTAGAATFTPGTTALDAANVAVIYRDIAVLPHSM